MENTKNILIIGDMPGYGKMGLAGMLPILSNLGHSVYNLPTALVSNNFDYGTFSVLDTTDYMRETIQVWQTLGFPFDCITTGFLASSDQVDLLRNFIDNQRKEDLLVVTDPIMGDGGKLYNGSNQETVDNMRRLIGAADVIVPNLTEAEFLTGLCLGRETLTKAEVRRMLDGLLSCGPRSAVVTSGREEETGRHVVWGFDGRTGEYFTVPYRFIKAHFPGTGDIFTSLLTDQLLKGCALPQAVGKAVNLHNRVRSYFRKIHGRGPQIEKMVQQIARFEYIVTDSELEALVLENNLIKENSPKYNTLLKDDKTYPFIKVTVSEEFPRVLFSREMKKDRSRYFGPYTSAAAVKDTIELLNKLFKLRTCNRVLPRDLGQERPCLNHHIGQCLAPCQGYIDQEEYRKRVDQALDFLGGNYNMILKDLEKKMQDAAEELNFEEAIRYRDLFESVKSVSQKQKITHSDGEDKDLSLIHI